MSDKSSFSFDAQARDFDRRTGFAEHAAGIAAAVVRRARLTESQLLVDLGAGTGEIGAELRRGVSRYLALDVSREMLLVFRDRTAPEGTDLVQADAARDWPLRDNVANALFLSRFAHLIDGEHLACELLRTGCPGAAVILGRTCREPGSVRTILRRKMRELLTESGITGRSGGAAADRLIGRLVEAGARQVPSEQAARREVSVSPERVLEGWADKSGLAGVALDPVFKKGVLEDLREFARKEFSDLQTPRASVEFYVLQGVELAVTQEGLECDRPSDWRTRR